MAEDPDEVLGLVNHLVRLVLVRGGEEVDSEVAHEVDSDRSRLRDRQRSAPPSTPRELALDVSARADASTCVPTSARRAVALLCALFTTFKRKRARERARRRARARRAHAQAARARVLTRKAHATARARDGAHALAHAG